MTFKVDQIEIGVGKPLFFIAGPCVIESWELTYHTAQALKEISIRLGVGLVFKSSFDKANRTSLSSFRGPGLDAGLEMLAQIKRKLGLPVLSDVHEPGQCKRAGAVLDVLQIPAFLCRQTDLIVAAARTRQAVNIKKGQFVSPEEVLRSAAKAIESGNDKVFITERGTTFGYNNLVVDYRSFPIIRGAGHPIVFDATHSVQLPGGGGGVSSGQRQYVPTLARAAVAAGCDGVFMEVHPDPDSALSDGPNQVPLAQVGELWEQLLKIHTLATSLAPVELPGSRGSLQPAAAQ